jgi:hypothetical protein
MSEQHVIIIAHEAFGAGYDVKVVPPLPGEPLDAEFAEYRKARGWAGGLRMTRGWRIVDQTGEHD